MVDKVHVFLFVQISLLLVMVCQSHRVASSDADMKLLSAVQHQGLVLSARPAPGSQGQLLSFSVFIIDLKKK